MAVVVVVVDSIFFRQIYLFEECWNSRYKDRIILVQTNDVAVCLGIFLLLFDRIQVQAIMVTIQIVKETENEHTQVMCVQFKFAACSL